MNSIEEQKDILAKFERDKSLNELESRFNKFNIFDCLKLARTEIRHSNFLGWLLDPNETHNLKDNFLKEFIKNVLIDNKTYIEQINGRELTLNKYGGNNEFIKETYTIPSIADIEHWDMSNSEVFREKEYIDLLIVDENNKFVLLIENKIDTGQHDNQLSKYREYIDNQYPNLTYKKLYVYLKPQKENVEKPYIYTSYELIKNCLSTTLKHVQVNEEVNTIINHYIQVIERDIMQKENIGKMCVQIYKKHKKAIDLINKYSNVSKEETFDIIETVIKDSDLFSYYTFDKDSNHITCLPKGINNIEKFNFSICQNQPIINLHFWNFRYGKDLYFEIGINAAINDVGKVKRKELIQYIVDNIKSIKFNNTESWAYSKPRFVILSENEYYDNDCDAEKLSSLISNRLNDKYAPILEEFSKVLNSWSG